MTGDTFPARSRSRASLASAFAIAACLQGQVQAAEPPPPPIDMPAFLDAFSVDYGRPACQQKSPLLVGHIEEMAIVLSADAAGSRPFYKHPAVATQILWDRLNANHTACIPVHLIDASAIRDSAALRTTMAGFGVVTVSSFQYWFGVGQQRTEKEIAAALSTENPPFPEYESLMRKRDAFGTDARIDADFWDHASDAVVVAAATNEGNSAEDGRKRIGHTSIYDTGGLILAGALADEERAASYSTPGADLAWFTGFRQGFITHAYANRAEIDGFERRFNRRIKDGPSVNVDSLSQTDTGTSFVSTDLGGLIYEQRLRHPELNKLAVAAAACLATTQRNVTDNGKFVDNARGLPFDDDRLGHGAFLPARFARYMDAAARYRQAGYGTETTRMMEVGIADGESFRFNVAGRQTIGRVTGSLTFAWRQVGKNFTHQLPETATLTSPAGSRYAVRLRTRSVGTDTVVAGFTSSAWLGEAAAGAWRIGVTPDYTVTGARLETIGLAADRPNVIDRLVDFARAERRTPHMSRPAAMATAPWRAKIAGGP